MLHIKAVGSGTALLQVLWRFYPLVARVIETMFFFPQTSVSYHVPELVQEEAFHVNVTVIGKMPVFPVTYYTEPPPLPAPVGTPADAKTTVNITVDNGDDFDHVDPIGGSHNFFEEGMDVSTCLRYHGIVQPLQALLHDVFLCRWRWVEIDSGMVVIEIGLLSGFTAEKDGLEQVCQFVMCTHSQVSSLSHIAAGCKE